VPARADDAAVNARVDVPEPGAAMDAGLNAAATPLGNPDTLSAMAELKPPNAAVVMVLVPFAPCAIVIDAGDAERLNAGVVTVSETTAVWVTPAPVPVTVMV
jgi:hypothetical protein